MQQIDILKKDFLNFIQQKFNVDNAKIQTIEFNINIDEDKKNFGDINSNAALILSKELKTSPKEIADVITSNFKNKYIEKIETAGPGFINIFFTNEMFIELTRELYNQKEEFFKPNLKEIENYHFSIEFVSANPTGPLHIGSGRGGIIGDVLGNILKFLGYKVTKEYYINDAGNQIKKLGESLKVRCLQELKIPADIPEEGYQGEYLIDLAKKCLEQYGKEVIDKENKFFEDYAKNHLLEQIKHTLENYGIIYDTWFSEKSLYDSGEVNKAINRLTSLNHTYQKDNALWFKSTEFGDDKDRVIIKSNGDFTYAASDLAYMLSKIDRGANFLIMVLGHDHHGYANRLKGMHQALGLQEYPFNIIFNQLVKMKQSDQFVRMSKRAGNIITLNDIINTVGKDVARFFYLNRKADAQLEFDLDLALKKTEENPVYYIQYAYVRTNALLDKANEEIDFKNITIDDAINIGSEEYFLIKKIIYLKTILESISKNYQTHVLTFYIIELATIFHRYYYNNRIIDQKNIPTSKARLLATKILKDTFELCFNLIGITAPQRM